MQTQLATECGSGCKLWPDASAPDAAARAKETRPEKFMFVPDWIVHQFHARGRLGYWGQLKPSVPQQVWH